MSLCESVCLSDCLSVHLSAYLSAVCYTFSPHSPYIFCVFLVNWLKIFYQITLIITVTQTLCVRALMCVYVVCVCVVCASLDVSSFFSRLRRHLMMSFSCVTKIVK